MNFQHAMENRAQTYLADITNAGNETFLECTADMNKHYSNIGNNFETIKTSMQTFQKDIDTKMKFFTTIGDLVTTTENAFKRTMEEMKSEYTKTLEVIITVSAHDTCLYVLCALFV